MSRNMIRSRCRFGSYGVESGSDGGTEGVRQDLRDESIRVGSSFSGNRHCRIRVWNHSGGHNGNNAGNTGGGWEDLDRIHSRNRTGRMRIRIRHVQGIDVLQVPLVLDNFPFLGNFPFLDNFLFLGNFLFLDNFLSFLSFVLVALSLCAFPFIFPSLFVRLLFLAPPPPLLLFPGLLLFCALPLRRRRRPCLRRLSLLPQSLQPALRHHPRHRLRRCCLLLLFLLLFLRPFFRWRPCLLRP
mmetsp:Transcript_17230/g.31435  ORF Transcript_17230/g.31435 Transcript_17230/m.31435 type:complete len:241 (-) Transcript_17230:1775-2497(-)